MSFLANIELANFNKLIEVTEASKGNLSVQLSKLEEAGYIEIHKTFKGKYPLTQCAITDKGRSKLKTYVTELKSLLNL